MGIPWWSSGYDSVLSLRWETKIPQTKQWGRGRQWKPLGLQCEKTRVLPSTKWSRNSFLEEEEFREKPRNGYYLIRLPLISVAVLLNNPGSMALSTIHIMLWSSVYRLSLALDSIRLENLDLYLTSVSALELPHCADTDLQCAVSPPSLRSREAPISPFLLNFQNTADDI